MNVLIGNTYRLRISFRAFPTTGDTGQYSDVDGAITFKVFAPGRVQVGTTVTLTASNHESVGVYSYDYTIPDGYSRIVAEFDAVLDGKAVRATKEFEPKWSLQGGG
jgi:hypothetical protein